MGNVLVALLRQAVRTPRQGSSFAQGLYKSHASRRRFGEFDTIIVSCYFIVDVGRSLTSWSELLDFERKEQINPRSRSGKVLS